MALGRRIKVDHSGAKNGGGHYGTRAEAKTRSNKLRRAADRRAAKKERE